MKNLVASRALGFASVLALLQPASLFAADVPALGRHGCDILWKSAKLSKPDGISSTVDFVGKAFSWIAGTTPPEPEKIRDESIGQIATAPDGVNYVMTTQRTGRNFDFPAGKDKFDSWWNVHSINAEAAKPKTLLGLTPYSSVDKQFAERLVGRKVQYRWTHTKQGGGGEGIWQLEVSFSPSPKDPNALGNDDRTFFIQGSPSCANLLPKDFQKKIDDAGYGTEVDSGWITLQAENPDPTLLHILDIAKRTEKSPLAQGTGRARAYDPSNPMTPMLGMIQKEDGSGAPRLADMPSVEQTRGVAGAI